MGFVPLKDRPNLKKRVGGHNMYTDPEYVLVSSVFPLLKEYNNQQLADALGVDESRIRHMRKQHIMSFRIADALLTFAGIGYLLGHQIKVRETASVQPYRPGQWDETDTPSDEPA